MSFLDGLTRRGNSAAESRSLENPNIPISSAAVAQYFGVDQNQTSAGVTVTPNNATNNSAVWRCISLISGVCGSLPLQAYATGTYHPAVSKVLENPHPDMTAGEFWGLQATHRGLHGNFYAQKMRDGMGNVVELWPVMPERITGITRITSGEYRGLKLFAVRLDDGTTEPMSSRDILHVPHWSSDGMVGISPVRAMRMAVGLSMAAEEYGARLFGSGNLATGILQTEARLNEKDAEALKLRWEKKQQGLAKSHNTVILDNGAKFHQLTMPNSDSQFLQSRQFQILEIGRFFGVPPFLLMETEKATSWGTGLEQQALGWLTFDVAPRWLAPLEGRLTKEITGEGIEARYDMNKLLRGDSAAMAVFFRTMREIGVLNADEIRNELGREPLPNKQGQVYLMPSNMQSLAGNRIDGTTGADVNKTGLPDTGGDVTAADTPANAGKGGK